MYRKKTQMIAKLKKKSESIEEKVEPETNKKKFEEENSNDSKSVLKGPVVTGERGDLSQFEKKKQKVASSSQVLKRRERKKKKNIQG